MSENSDENKHMKMRFAKEHISKFANSDRKAVSVGAERNLIEFNKSLGATIMKSVSLFLMSSRKGPVNANQQNSSAISTKENPRRARRKRMLDSSINSLYVTKIIESLKKKTRFSRMELNSLYKFYKKLMANAGQQVEFSINVYGRSQPAVRPDGIDRTIFRDLIHNTFKIITKDILVERLFNCWDHESEGAIKLEPWIVGLDVFLRGSLQDRTKFCFRVYDLNNDGYIAKDEIFQLFKDCLIKQPGEEDPDESIRDLSELALKKMDTDCDGKISLHDYMTAVEKETLLLEAFGQCLPTEQDSLAFLTSLQDHCN